MYCYGNNFFDIINYQNKGTSQIQCEENNIFVGCAQPIIQEHNYLKITTLKEAINIYKKVFSERIPKIDSKKEIHKYILNTMKNEDEMNLNDKYIFSIYLALNKHLLTKTIKKDIMEEEFHLMLINWLIEEKKFVEEELKENPNNVYYFNIFIGLLINIISILEILHIKTNDLLEFYFCKKLYKIYKFVKLNINLNINVSLFFLIIKIEKILKKWDNQLECYHLAKNIKDYNEKKELMLLGKKTKRNADKDKDKEDTEADSSSDRGESNYDIKVGIKNKNKINKNKTNKNKTNKKVYFDLENNIKIFYDKDKKVSEHLINDF